jgi:hypothetical protein
MNLPQRFARGQLNTPNHGFFLKNDALFKNREAWRKPA